MNCMKTIKEYPATHSMDTAWFAVDLDGNVAIFQFEENGPGPIPFTDLHTDELIPFLGDNSGVINTLNFSEEQLSELQSNLKDVMNVEQIKQNCNILIVPDCINELIEAHAIIDLCYSKEQGFYHLDWWDSSDIKIQEYIDAGKIKKYSECDIEIYFEDQRMDQSQHRLAKFPFYVYEQGCYINRAPERVVIPRYPFREEQLSERAKKYMFHLPVHFAKDKYVEPAEFIDSECWIFNNKTIDENGITYMQVALTNGGYGFVKVIPYSHTPEYPENWDKSPRVINIGDTYCEE